jgi:hypothetical protein
MAIATNHGYPRFGPQRELKWTLEKYWRGRTNAETLHHLGRDLRHAQQRLPQLGIQHIPANDFSLYDHVLDTIALLGALPERYGWHGDTVELATVRWRTAYAVETLGSERVLMRRSCSLLPVPMTSPLKRSWTPISSAR